MGALSYMAAGLAEGAGRGVAGYGAEMSRQADHNDLLRERQQNSMDMERLRQQDRLELQRERAATGHAKGTGTPTAAQQLSELGDMLLSGQSAGPLMGGGMAREQAVDTAAIAAGNEPMVDTPMRADRFTNPDRQDDAAAQPGTARIPKYTSGQAAAMMKEASLTLRRAMGIVNPGASDDIAKAEQTETVTEMGKNYAAGDAKQGAGALVLQGKAPYGEYGSGLDGSVPAKSVAESIVTKNKAAAGNSSASAGQHTAMADKIRAEINGDLANDVSKERLATMLNSLNTYSKDMDLTDPQKADLNALRQEITQKMRNTVNGGDAKVGGRAAPADALSQARTAIAGGANREAVIQRLRGMGISTKGL